MRMEKTKKYKKLKKKFKMRKLNNEKRSKQKYI